jgi:prephenate dehydrogenase
MTKAQITILGLGVTGSSLGLALQRSAAQADIVGHDKSPEASQVARKAAAVQRVEWNLHAACEPASLIVLAMPLGEVAETLDLIREDLRLNTLVFVLADVLEPAAALLSNHLPGHQHGVVGHAILNGIGSSPAARADLFDGTTFVVAASAATDPSALELAANFVESVGAQPLFMDPVEHDGIIAGVEQLPQLLGMVLVHQSAAAPGWPEARRLAGRAFAQATAPSRSAQNLYTSLAANRSNVLQRIESFERELSAWKQWLASAPLGGEEGGEAGGEAPPLQQALTDSFELRSQWEEQANLHNWDTSPAADNSPAPSGGLLRQMFLGSWGKKPPPQGPTN